MGGIENAESTQCISAHPNPLPKERGLRDSRQDGSTREIPIVKYSERYVHTGEIAMNVAEWPAPPPSASSPVAPVMVLIHGYGSNWHTWGRVTDRLAQDFHLYAVDLRGMGRSGRFGMSPGRQVWADDVAVLTGRLSDRPVTLIGHSLGGWVAAAVAAQHPELVSKAVLVEPYSGAHSGVRREERARRDEHRERQAELIRSAITPADLIPAVRERYVDASEDSVQRIARMWFELDPILETGLTRPSDDTETFDEMFSAIRCPTLIVRGAVEKGGIMSNEEVARVAALIPDSRDLYWPRVGHSPHIARNHDFIRAVKRFHAE